MYQITTLAKASGLSRSTLLYYDRIGLLCPSGRSAAGYRLYSARDKERLALICSYRQAGLALEAPEPALVGPVVAREDVPQAVRLDGVLVLRPRLVDATVVGGIEERHELLIGQFALDVGEGPSPLAGREVQARRMTLERWDSLAIRLSPMSTKGCAARHTSRHATSRSTSVQTASRSSRGGSTRWRSYR